MDVHQDPKKTWTVVLFETDESVEAIPTSWLTSPTECVYPPFTGDKVLQAIKNQMDLNTCWPTFKVRPFRNATYGDYAVARQKSIKAQETSELSSENDVIKRRRTRRVYSTDSDFSDEFSLKIPPKVPSKILNLPRKPYKLESSSKVVQEHQTAEKIEEPISPDTPVSCYRLDSHNSPSTPNGLNPSSTPLTKKSKAETSAAKNNPCSTCGSYLQEILQVQYFNRQILKDILMEVRSNKGNTGAPIQDSNSIHKSFSLPLQCDSDFDKLNNHLGDTDNFNNAVDEICLLGGHNNYDFVRRSLSMIMTNDLAVLYSWLGRRDKKAFFSLKIAKVIIEAASKSKKAVDRKETENSIASWLRRAGDRKKTRVSVTKRD